MPLREKIERLVRVWLAEAEYAIISSDRQIVASNFIGNYESYVREIWAVHGQALKPREFTFVSGVASGSSVPLRAPGLASSALASLRSIMVLASWRAISADKICRR